MCIFPVLVLLILPNILSASPTPPSPPNDFYNALVASCQTITEVVKSQSFIQQDVFKNCKNWTEIEQTKNLTKYNENNVRCLLYFDSFVSFCAEIKSAKIQTIDEHFIIPDLKNYNANSYCKNWTLAATKKLEHNTSKSITTEHICKSLCTTYENTVLLECSLALHFANFNVTMLPAPRETSNNIKSVLPEAAPPPVAPLVAATLNGNKSQGSAPQTADSHNEAPSVRLAGTNVGAQEQQQTEMDKPRSILHIGTSDNLEEAQQQPANPQETAEEVQASNVPEARSALVGKNAPAVIVPPLAEGDHSKVEEAKPAAGSATDLQDTQKDSKQNEKNQVEAIPDQEESVADEGAVVDDGAAKTNLEKVEEERTDIGEYDDEHDDENKAEHGEDPDENDNVEKDKPLASEVDKKQEQVEKQKVEPKAKQETKQSEEKNNVVVDSPINQSSENMEGASNFFSYFMVVCVLFILGYVGYHNRQKVMALVLEGKRGKRQYRGRRPNSANYHKLDSNLEEAISSTCTKNSSHVIY